MSREPDGVAARRTGMRAVLALVVLLGLGSACGDAPPEAPPSAAGKGWGRLPDGPLAARTGATVVGIDDLAYVFGGSEFTCPPNADCGGPVTPPFADGAVVDLGTGAWSSMADAPFGFEHASAAVVDGDIYVRAERRLLRYAPDEDAWTDLGTPPRGIGSATLVATEHGLLGLSPVSGVHAVYDARRESWTRLPEEPFGGSYDRFAVPDGDRVLVFASPTGPPDEGALTKLVAAYDFGAGTWTELAASDAGGYQAWGIGDRVFINPHFSKDGGGLFDLVTGTWSDIPDEGSGWTGDAAGVVSDDGATYEYDAGWVFDARDDGWLEVPERRGEVYDESIGSVGQALVVFGGQRFTRNETLLVDEAWVWRPPVS